MGWWDTLTETVSGYFGGGAPEYFPHVPEAGYEYYDPSYGMEYMPHVPEAAYEYYDPSYGTEPWYGSLWGAFKEVLESPLLPAGLGLLAPTREKGALTAVAPPKRIAPGERQNYQMYTPYPRKDSGTTPIMPIPLGAAPGKGISPTILLIAAAGAAYFLLRGK